MIQLYKGDCLEVMKGIETSSIDAIITDPPYGTTACKWDSVIDFDLMWLELNRIIKPNRAIVLFGSEPFSSLLRCSNLKGFKYDWIWEKSKASNFVLAKKQPLKAHEIISVFNSKIYNPQKTQGKPYNKGREKRNGNLTGFLTEVTNSNNYLIENKSGLRNPRSVQYFVTAEREGKYHPTQKPVALMEYLIKTYTNENETVLDFTMGSGSTGVACKNTNRNFIGIEKDEKYFEIAKERINIFL
jgi:site-specific DNA-methyltransferase (adenine-specific)